MRNFYQWRSHHSNLHNSLDPVYQGFPSNLSVTGLSYPNTYLSSFCLQLKMLSKLKMVCQATGSYSLFLGYLPCIHEVCSESTSVCFSLVHLSFVQGSQIRTQKGRGEIIFFLPYSFLSLFDWTSPPFLFWGTFQGMLWEVLIWSYILLSRI